MNIKAYAKINLALDVLSKRPDGYHEVRMIMQQINLYDKVRIQKINTPSISLTTNLFYVPKDERNIAYQAAALLMKQFSLQEGVQIHIEKHIPVGAGLAGGSSNGAAVLMGMNQMFRLGLALEDLLVLGAQLGADVPFCIMGGAALSEGIGEKLTPIQGLPSCPILLCTPSFCVSTAKTYKRYSEMLEKMQSKPHPNIDQMILDLHQEKIDNLPSNMINVLENVTLQEHPVIDEIKQTIRQYDPIAVLMSGSGPTVFAIFHDSALESARRAHTDLARTYNRTFLVTPRNEKAI